jgi:hypothetical protein
VNAGELEEWRMVQSGIDYNHRINLYETVNKNERFYAGNQWEGVIANGLPTPVFNIFKRIINYFIASILSQQVKMQFVAEQVGDTPNSEEEEYMKEAAELLSLYSETLWEKKKMNQKLRQVLLDAAISGDAAAYSFWNASISGIIDEGDIDLELPDNVNVFFGNPSSSDVEKQPYILITSREMVGKLREEAKANGMSDDQIRLITADNETFYQSGDRSKIELEEKDTLVGKTISILKLWKKDGQVMAKKITKYCVIKEEWDTLLTRYPLAWMNWDVRKNSYHGQAIGTGLTPNQIFINKMFAMTMMSLMQHAFPKAIYNKNFISGWNNQIGGAIGIDGDLNAPIGNYAQYLAPGQISGQVFQVIETAIQYTKDMLGASDAALGDVKPENTSAIIAVQQASAVPLENVKMNLYQFVEDIGYIWLDFMANYYGKRTIDVEVMGKRAIKEFDFEKLRGMKFRIKIDVGPSSYWSQITSLQTLDNLLQSEKISFLQYLERLPSGIIQGKQDLIENVKSQDTKQKFIYEQMARFLEQLPPPVQQSISSLPPEEQEAKLMELMMMPPQELPMMLNSMMPAANNAPQGGTQFTAPQGGTQFTAPQGGTQGVMR